MVGNHAAALRIEPSSVHRRWAHDLARRPASDVRDHVRHLTERTGGLGIWRQGGRVPVQPLILAEAAVRSLHALGIALNRLCVDHAMDRSRGDLARLADQLGWPAGERWFLGTGRPLEDALVASRTDMFVAGGRARILEININSCLNGGTATSVLSHALLDSAPGRDLAGACRLRSWSYLEQLALWLRRRLAGGPCEVALLGYRGDGDEGDTRWVEDHARCFARHGLSCAFVPVDEAEVAGGMLACRGTRYGAAIRYFMATPADVAVDAVAARRHRLFFEALEHAAGTVLIGSYAGQLFGSKALLADLVQCERLSADQRRLVAHVPWLARLEPSYVRRNGERVDPIDWAARHRRDAVVKPANLHGSQGVVVGAAVTDAAWDEAIGRAVREGGHVVQERVSPDAWTIRYWDIAQEALVDVSNPVLLGAFALDGRDGGCSWRQPLSGGAFDLADRRADTALGCVMSA